MLYHLIVILLVIEVVIWLAAQSFLLLPFIGTAYSR